MPGIALTLCANRLTDGTTSGMQLPQDQDHAVQAFSVYAMGTFAGASATLQATPDGTNWASVPDAVFTTTGIINVELAAMALRVVIAGANTVSGTTSLTIIVRG